MARRKGKHWNYRVMRVRTGLNDDTYLAVFEVHYASDDDSDVINWSSSPQPVVTGVEEGIETIDWALTEMRKALAKPVLDYETGKALA